MPGDFSAAAPFIVAGTLLAGSELTLHGLNLNPRRTGLLDVLERMGANVTVFNRRRIGWRACRRPRRAPRAARRHRRSPRRRCRGSSTSCRCSRSLAAHAHGDSRLRGAAELRAKETDRIEAVVDGLRRIGAHIRATDDGFVVRGVPSRLRGGWMETHGDHRIAMLAAVAGITSREGVEIRDAEAVAVSFPGFYELLDSLRLTPSTGASSPR